MAKYFQHTHTSLEKLENVDEILSCVLSSISYLSNSHSKKLLAHVVELIAAKQPNQVLTTILTEASKHVETKTFSSTFVHILCSAAMSSPLGNLDSKTLGQLVHVLLKLMENLMKDFGYKLERLLNSFETKAVLRLFANNKVCCISM